MKILAIDSSGLTASAAVATEEAVLAEYTTNYKKTHSQTLLPMIDEIIRMTETDLATIDAIAVSAGPGSFTGLRIGAATAKGLGQALKKPLIAVPTTEMLAWNLCGTGGVICPLMDARRSQVYTGLYRWNRESAAMDCLTAQCAVPVEEVIAGVNRRGEPVTYLGDGVDAYREVLEKMTAVPFFLAPLHLGKQRAASLAACAFGYAAKGGLQTAAEFVPVYLRKSQAEREREEKSRKLRRMSAEDVAEVAALEAENFSRPWSAAAFEGLLSDENYIVLVLREAEMLAGYCVLLCAGEEADITNVCTAAPVRGQGVATALLTALMKEGSARAVKQYFLEVRQGNQAARALYKKLGFQETGIRKDYYEEPRENAVLMKRME